MAIRGSLVSSHVHQSVSWPLRTTDFQEKLAGCDMPWRLRVRLPAGGLQMTPLMRTPPCSRAQCGCTLSLRESMGLRSVMR